MEHKGFELVIRTDHYRIWRSKHNPALSILEQSGKFKPSMGRGYIGRGEYDTLESAINAFDEANNGQKTNT